MSQKLTPYQEALLTELKNIVFEKCTLTLTPEQEADLKSHRYAFHTHVCEICGTTAYEAATRAISCVKSDPP